MFALEGVNFGFQLGGQATDFVLLVMNARGAKGILTGKVKLGADAAAAAGEAIETQISDTADNDSNTGEQNAQSEPAQN